MAGKYRQIEQFEAICADPYQTARTVAAQGRPVAGYMCTYTPEELLHAVGYFPVRILGRNAGSTNRADAHLPAYACGFVRSALDMALAGELDFMRLMVFSHTCDTMQNLADIWLRAVPQMKNITITTPVTVGNEAAIKYFREELARARSVLEAQVGAISDEAIEASIALYDRHRASMQRLYAFRRTHPACLSGREMMAVVLSSLLMPREDHLPLLDSLLTELEQAPAESASKPALLVVGNMCQNLDYVSAIEDAGCLMVDEDLCTGARAFAMQAQRCGDVLERLARMYLMATACPTKHQPDYDMAGALLKEAKDYHAAGMLFLFTKFCDPWCFDYPYLKKAFDEAGIPNQLIEVETNQPPAEQFRNRIQAFVEMLQTA